MLGVVITGLHLVAFVHVVGRANAMMSVAAAGATAYALWNELVRIKALRGSNAQLHLTCRRLTEARRAAGLLRLEQDLRGRRTGWFAP